jgi:hypothetical protein
MHEDEEYTENETEQSCFDIVVSSLVEGVMHDEEMELDENDKSYIIDEILNVLEDHLDEEGLDMLNEAFEKFQTEYELQVKTEDIINSFEWNQDKEE